MTVVETAQFIRDATSRMTGSERSDLVFYLAANPEAGVLITDTGGVRKLRWAVGGRGKSGGVRVIYYYHSPGLPLFVLGLFSKSERANLSQAERNRLRVFVKKIVASYPGRGRLQ